jgi:hypothetical protein
VPLQSLREDARTLAAISMRWGHHSNCASFRARLCSRESITRFLRSPALVLLLLIAAVLFPTTNVARFDGVPLSSPHEILFLLLGVTALLSAGLRRRYNRILELRRGVFRRILLIAAVMALIAKGALLATGVSEGFAGCYSSPVAPAPTCERSFANPLLLHGATRIDREIDFGARESAAKAVAYPFRDVVTGALAQSSWNLGFVNSLQFNFYEPGAIDRGRLPLNVRWTGTVGTEAELPLTVQYVGEVAVAFKGATTQFPRSYSALKVARLSVPRGRSRFMIDYRFDRAGRIGEPTARPYARLQVRLGERPLTAAPPALLARAEAAVVDLALGVLGISVAYLWIGILLSLWPFVVGTAAGAALAIAAANSAAIGQSTILVAVVWGLTVTLAWRRPHDGLSFGFVALVGLAIVQSADTFPSPDAVLYRGGGSDWLTYESFARDIFTTHSLQGGEDVFYYQPGYRYLLLPLRLLLGEGDMLPSALAQALTNFAILVLGWRLAERTPLRSFRAALIALGIALMLGLLYSSTILSFFRVGASEWPTWAAIPAAVALLFCGRGRRDALAGTLLLAVALLMRPNQAPALGLLLLLAVGPLFFTRWRTAVACLSIFAALALLPAVHNVVYGNTLVFTPTGANVPQNLLLRPSELDGVFDDRATRELLVDQAARTFYFKPAEEFVAALPYSGSLARLFHGLQLLWVAAIVFALAKRRLLSFEAKALLLVPALLLLPFLFYNPLIYYPRHMVAGHLAMAVSAMFVFSGHARERRSGVPRPSLGRQLPRRWRRRRGAPLRDTSAGAAG